MDVKDKIAHIAAVFFLLGVIFISLGIPISALLTFFPEGKAAFFFNNWVLILGIVFIVLCAYIIFWGASFQKVLNFCRKILGVQNAET